MNGKSFGNMSNNSDFIPGIYNYCDQWCERCPYTSRCSLFASEKEQFPDDESRDMANQKFWIQMEDLLKATFEILDDVSKELNLDLDQISAEPIEQNEKEARSRATNHPAANGAQQYISEVNKWFEESESLFDKKREELSQLATLNLSEEKIETRINDLRDFIEVIRWYQHQIYAKIMRAIQGKIDGLPAADPIQNDYNGSAKVALIGIKRSMAAWTGLLDAFPEKEDETLSILVLVKQVQRQLKKEFPDAQKFKRPGFDE